MISITCEGTWGAQRRYVQYVSKHVEPQMQMQMQMHIWHMHMQIALIACRQHANKMLTACRPEARGAIRARRARCERALRGTQCAARRGRVVSVVQPLRAARRKCVHLPGAPVYISYVYAPARRTRRGSTRPSPRTSATAAAALSPWPPSRRPGRHPQTARPACARDTTRERPIRLRPPGATSQVVPKTNQRRVCFELRG